MHIYLYEQSLLADFDDNQSKLGIVRICRIISESQKKMYCLTLFEKSFTRKALVLQDALKVNIFLKTVCKVSFLVTTVLHDFNNFGQERLTTKIFFGEIKV